MTGPGSPFETRLHLTMVDRRGDFAMRNQRSAFHGQFLIRDLGKVERTRRELASETHGFSLSVVHAVARGREKRGQNGCFKPIELFPERGVRCTFQVFV